LLIFLAGFIFRKDSPSLTFSYYNNQGLTPDSVTDNTKEFERIVGLYLENWVE